MLYDRGYKTYAVSEKQINFTIYQWNEFKHSIALSFDRVNN